MNSIDTRFSRNLAAGVLSGLKPDETFLLVFKYYLTMK